MRIDPATGAARRMRPLDEPLSDLGAATVAGKTYLVGGYTGAKYATAILRVGRGNRTTTVARLPVGLRYPGVATLGGKIYVAGGVISSGESRAVYEFDPRSRTRPAHRNSPGARGTCSACSTRRRPIPDRRELSAPHRPARRERLPRRPTAAHARGRERGLRRRSHRLPRRGDERRLRAAQTSRCCVAQRVSSCRDESWSLRRTLDTWLSTVFTDRWSRVAISLYM